MAVTESAVMRAISPPWPSSTGRKIHTFSLVNALARVAIGLVQRNILAMV